MVGVFLRAMRQAVPQDTAMTIGLSVSKKHLRDPKYKLWEKAKQDQNSDVGHQEWCRAKSFLAKIAHMYKCSRQPALSVRL